MSEVLIHEVWIHEVWIHGVWIHGVAIDSQLHNRRLDMLSRSSGQLPAFRTSLTTHEYVLAEHVSPDGIFTTVV